MVIEEHPAAGRGLRPRRQARLATIDAEGFVSRSGRVRRVQKEAIAKVACERISCLVV